MIASSTRDTLITFLNRETLLPKILVVYGPTASGKSAMAVAVGAFLRDRGYEPHIISADSRQVYRGLDIGTGKIKEGEMGGIPHHMLDVILPNEKYSMIDFRRDVDTLEFFHATNQVSGQPTTIPILCGGTGLYIDAVLYDMDYPENPPDWEYRKELEDIRAEKGNEYLWNMLFAIDPQYANELSPSNYRYIMRGLEVIRDTGKSKRESHNTKQLRFAPLFLTPYTDGKEERKFLYEKINTRVESMFINGLLEEVRYNIDTFSSNCPGLTTIGYKEVVDYLEGRSSLEDAITLVAQHSRNYAKRQITWNKKYDNFGLSNSDPN